jgi:hypothetical protein
MGVHGVPWIRGWDTLIDRLFQGTEAFQPGESSEAISELRAFFDSESTGESTGGFLETGSFSFVSPSLSLTIIPERKAIAAAPRGARELRY